MPPCVLVPCATGKCHRAGPRPPSKPAVPTPACVRGSRSSNHESRITAVPALPRAGGLPPQRPPIYATVCARPQPCQQPGSNATVRPSPAAVSKPTVSTPACVRGSRSSNHESRVTNHGRSGPPLCGGTPPATPPLSDATVRARPQLRDREVYATVRARPRLPCQSQPCRRQRACAAPAVRITNHESVTAVPALPCAGGLPPQRPPVYATVRARPRLPCQSQPCRRQRACAAPAVRITNHESRITAVPALPCAGGTPPATPP